MTKEKKPALQIDKRAYHKIKDISQKIWQDTRHPNINLVMFEALRQYVYREGYDPGFEIPSVSEALLND